ncbi:ankyrin repeat domain-containing protein 17 [Anguilla anguilla]|uniref:ankyrin repeat domain-containing protein 17 n=1 Tax=Anguilla anguilla TaxID=7936 RepID=UPI0015ABB8EF|nr:ankyrin repeat domain-containing protein 17 [Anguilla anguilla]
MLRPKDLCQGSGTKTFLDAMHSGKIHLARFVLDALDGRIINSKTENSRTPLMFAVCLPESGARVKFTRLLLEKGADVNCQDEHGRTALSLACEQGHLDSIKLLVQFNADPEVSDAWGNSALMYAAYAGHSQVLEFLVRAFKRLGLRLDQTNRAGHSAIQVADLYGHNQCVQALNIPGKRTGSDNLGDAYLGTELGGERRRPNRLPKQVLERFTQQFHSKCEEHLPAVFQRQMRVGESSGLRRRLKGHNQSPDRKGQPKPLFNHSQKLCSKDEQDAIFEARQIQNSKLRDKMGATTLDQHPLSHQEDVNNAGGIIQEAQETGPVWGKAKSFNLEHLPCRKQSYQDDLSDATHSTVRIKRGSLQDEQTLMRKTQCQEISADKSVPAPRSFSNGKKQVLEATDDGLSPHSIVNESSGVSLRREFKKRSSLPQYGRQDKILFHREEIAPERIQLRPPGFTGLGTRLLRRFTAPEFMRLVMDFPSEHGRGKISRSETFPFTSAHLKVNSQPSVDSISGVTCEFESNGARRLALG